MERTQWQKAPDPFSAPRRTIVRQDSSVLQHVDAPRRHATHRCGIVTTIANAN
ncbi:hypothetical protein [Lacipirellula sp.]|uniref:hypothetical protein n=1 Tax=Lacipirellula sp. TaxID=2691419 RepID=UPI003D0FCA87